jgi:acetyl-CoA C-acetyltransferase
VTAGNASSIADGAAVLLLMKQSTAIRYGLIPLARIISHATSAIKPALYPIAPIEAIKKLLSQCHWSVNDVDLFEVNEAFAVVTLAAMKALTIPHDKMNVHGGGCALGHPIGASGARILVTLLHALKRLGKSRGVASLCIGGGEATAIAVELC